jgi:hypothetical protein
MLRCALKMIAAAWLFCGFLVISSVDRIPDPPAIGPHGFDGKSLRAGACARPAADEPPAVVASSSQQQLSPRRLVAGIVPEIVASLHRFALISGAANTSPPHSLIS